MTDMLWQGTLETLYMTIVSTIVAYLIGLPVGVSLVVTDKNGIHPNTYYNKIIGFIVNVIRSVPFLILMIAILPYVRVIIGTGIGTTATVAVLIVSAAPFVARVVETSIKEIDPGVIEAAQSMGASNMTIVRKVMLTEARPALLTGAAVSTITVLGYSAMAGIVGGGGLGDIAIKYGYYRYETGIMWITVLLLVVIVQVLQEIGMKVAFKTDNRN